MLYNDCMDLGYFLDLVYEFAFFLGVFAFFLTFAIFKGRQAVMNVTAGLYLAIVVTTYFPNYSTIFPDASKALPEIGFFAFIALLATLLFFRIMPEEFQEKRFESMGKKLLLSFGATALTIAICFQLLSVGELLNANTPLQSLFAPKEFFFWWLLAPLAILYVV